MTENIRKSSKSTLIGNQHHVPIEMSQYGSKLFRKRTIHNTIFDFHIAKLNIQ